MPSVDLQTGKKGNNKSVPVKSNSSTNNDWGDWQWFNWLRDGLQSIVEHEAYGGLMASQTGGAGGLTPTTYASMATGDSSVINEAATGGIADIPISISEGEVEREVEYENPLPDSPVTTDAKTYGDLFGKSAEEMISSLIERDPENATGWLEQLIGIKAERENTQTAMNYDRFMSDTRIQRTARDLEAAGINPILAYQFLSGSSSSVGAAGVPSSNVSTNAVSRSNNWVTANSKTAVLLTGLLASILGFLVKAAL